MGGVSKAVSAISTLVLMLLSLMILNRYVNTTEYQLQQLLGQLFGGSTNEPTMLMMLIVVLGVVSIAGAVKG